MPVRRIAISVRRVPGWAPWVYRSVWVVEVGCCHGTLVDATIDVAVVGAIVVAVVVAVVGSVIDQGVAVAEEAHL